MRYVLNNTWHVLHDYYVANINDLHLCNFTFLILCVQLLLVYDTKIQMLFLTNSNLKILYLYVHFIVTSPDLFKKIKHERFIKHQPSILIQFEIITFIKNQPQVNLYHLKYVACMLFQPIPFLCVIYYNASDSNAVSLVRDPGKVNW